MHEQLQQGATVAISAISGMGGIGKTELALQYAQKQYREEFYLGGVCWLRAREEVGTQIISFARSCLELIPPDDLELLEKVRWCWGRWREGTALLIFDDVQNYEDVRSFLPPQESRFKVLMTTRSRFGHPVKDFEIKVLSEEKSLELLRAIVQDQRIDQDLATAKQVCEWLGYLPLGLELVGRYLAKKKDVSIAVLWQRLQDKRLFAKALLKAEPGMTASLGVTAAFELSWQELNKEAQQLAALLSLFALAKIPWAAVQACLPEADEEDLEDWRDEKLLELHLLTRASEGMYELHQLLREFFAAKREQMAEVEEWKSLFCQVMVNFALQIPQQPTLSVLQYVLPTIPHLKEAATTLESWLINEDLIFPFNGIARFYEGQTAFADAEEWYTQCLAIAETRLGQDHPEVATSFNNLASLYCSQGRYGDAEPLYLRSLEIDQQHYGDDHPEVAKSLNNLAELYRLQGHYNDAEPLHLQSLDIRQRHLEHDHPDLAQSFNNLASLYCSQGRYNDTELLCLRSLDIVQRQMGHDHPNVAASLNNLAELYRLQGRYNDAEPFYLRSLDIVQRQMGHDHPSVAASLNNLALLYGSQGRYSDAESLYLQTLAILFEKLGENHPNTQTTSENFLLLLQHVIQENRSDELSDHPLTRSLFQQLRPRKSKKQAQGFGKRSRRKSQ